MTYEVLLSVDYVNAGYVRLNTQGDYTMKKSKMYRMGATEALPPTKTLKGRMSYDQDLSCESEGLEEKYTELNHPGRTECDYLRYIRVKIAEANGIEFKTVECHHTEACDGTCLFCDDELAYLESELQKKREKGEKIVLDGISMEEIFESGCDLSYDVLDDDELGKDLIDF